MMMMMILVMRKRIILMTSLIQAVALLSELLQWIIHGIFLALTARSLTA